jgi:hypothetical protein
MPPWSQEHYERGFDDPYVFDRSLSPDGLIPDLDSARRFREILYEIHPPYSLEIICAVELEGPSDVDTSVGEPNHLGFDVASNRPFWSPLGDPPNHEAVRQYLPSRINSNGLFAPASDAFAYLDMCRPLPECDAPEDLRVWTVSVVE